MDLKNILEGTRQFFQGLPLPHSSSAPQGKEQQTEAPTPNHHGHLFPSQAPAFNSSEGSAHSSSAGGTVPVSASCTPNGLLFPLRKLEQLGPPPHHSTSLHNNLMHSSSQPSRPHNVLHHDGDPYRTKFAEEGLGATLSQYYRTGTNSHQEHGASRDSSTLNITRTPVGTFSPGSNSNVNANLPLVSRVPVKDISPVGVSRSPAKSVLLESPSKLTDNNNSTTLSDVVGSFNNSNSEKVSSNTPASEKVGSIMVGTVRRESPLDLSVKTVRTTADSSTSCLSADLPNASMGISNVNGTKSGSSTPSLTGGKEVGVITAVANSTTNLDSGTNFYGKSSRGRSKEKDSSRTSTPVQQRYPSPQAPQSSRQQSPSSTMSVPVPMHQRVANLNLTIPSLTPPPRTGSGSSAMYNNINSNSVPPSTSSAAPVAVSTPNQNHHLLNSYSHQPPLGQSGRSSVVSVPSPYPQYPSAPSTPLTIPSPAPSNSSLTSRVPPAYAPTSLGLTPSPYHHATTGVSAYHHPHISPYPQYHPHYAPQQQHHAQAAYYGYPPPPHPHSTHVPPPAATPTPIPPPSIQRPSAGTGASGGNSSQPPPTSTSTTPHYSSSHSQDVNKLSHPVSAYQPPPPSQPQPHQSPYYSPYYRHPQSLPGSRAASPLPHHHLTYPTYGHAHSQQPAPSPAPQYPQQQRYTQPISYPTYLPSAQRSSQPPAQAPAHPSMAGTPGYPTSYQPHVLRPTTPTGPPPPLTSTNANPYGPQNSVPPPSSSSSLPQQPAQASKPESSQKPQTTPKPKGSTKERKNVLNMLRNSVESRLHEKQEKEKFQFNSHQTWNFHGRKFNTTIPQPHQNNHGTPGSGSLGVGASAFLASASVENKPSSGTAELGGEGVGGSSGAFNSGQDESLQRIRTKAEKKQLFPNLLSQIEQENSHKEAGRAQVSSNFFNHDQSGRPTSVFDFNEDDEFGGGPKINIPQPPSSTVVPKKPRSPKKVDGNRRPSTGLKQKSKDSTETAFSAAPVSVSSNMDDFFATFDSFVDELQSNPNSITSRRGGLWKNIKSKTKPAATATSTIVADGSQPDPGATSTATQAPKPKKVGARGVRLKKRSSDEDSDFQVEEEKSEEDEEEEENSDNSSTNSKSSRLHSISSSSQPKKPKAKAQGKDKDKEMGNAAGKRKRVLESDEEGSEGEEESEDEERPKAKRRKQDASSDEDSWGPQSGKRGGRKPRRATRQARRRAKQIGSDFDEDELSSLSDSGSESYDFSSDGSTSASNSSADDKESGSEYQSSGSKLARRKKRDSSSRKRGRREMTRRTRRKGRALSDSSDEGRSKSKSSGKQKSKGNRREEDDEDDDDNFEPKVKSKRGGKERKRKLPKRNCAPSAGHGKLKDISGESENEVNPEAAGSSGEEWIMRGDLTKKKRKIVFGDGSDFQRPGWEEELIDFKKKLRMPTKLIQVARPSSITMSPASSVTGDKDKSSLSGSNTNKAAKENKVPGGAKTAKKAKEKPVVEEEKEKSTPKKAQEQIQQTKGKGPTPKKKETPAPKKVTKKRESAPVLSGSESPLDEPTIEKAVEIMKAAANTANAKAAKLALSKSKPVLSKANSVPARKTKGKNSSSLDDLPVLSPQTVLPTENEENAADAPPTPQSTEGPPITTPTTEKKKGIRRNKFKSGFDYIRKKKKAIVVDPAAPPPPPKKLKIPIEKNTTVDDVAAEVRGWVLNKGHGETALHRAARLGYPDVAAYCLEHEICPPNCKDNAGYTPLHETCIKGNLEVAKVLLIYGADPSPSAPGGIRPLHEACENGHVELVRLLISYGADPTLTTYAGQSPMELAESHEPVRLLLDQHINDVMGARDKPWEFKGSGPWVEDSNALGYDATADVPEQSDSEDSDGFEIEASENPLPPLYKLKEKAPYYILLNDIANYLGVPREKFLKTHPAAETVELNSNDFLEEAHCCHLLGEKFNLNSSSDLLILIKYDDKVKKMLNIESMLIR